MGLIGSTRCKYFNNRKRSEGGFTLVELMVVIAVIAILASIALPQFLSAGDKAQEGKVTADIRGIKNAAQLYMIDHASGVAPTVEELVKAGYLAEEVKTPQKGQYKIEVKDTGSGAKSIVVTNPDKVQ